MDAPEEDDIPPEIGPHEGKELELMLAGEKPVAMFNDDFPADYETPEEIFFPYVRNGAVVKREVVITFAKFNNDKMRYYFYALPGEEWRIERLIEIQRSLFEQSQKTTWETEKEIGELLGYQESDIEFYLNRLFNKKK